MTRWRLVADVTAYTGSWSTLALGATLEARRLSRRRQ